VTSARDERGMALGTENSPRFFGGGNSGVKFLHVVTENLHKHLLFNERHTAPYCIGSV
jgi:hypothetical protein